MLMPEDHSPGTVVAVLRLNRKIMNQTATELLPKPTKGWKYLDQALVELLMFGKWFDTIYRAPVSLDTKSRVTAMMMFAEELCHRGNKPGVLVHPSGFSSMVTRMITLKDGNIPLMHHMAPECFYIGSAVERILSATKPKHKMRTYFTYQKISEWAINTMTNVMEELKWFTEKVNHFVQDESMSSYEQVFIFMTKKYLPAHNENMTNIVRELHAFKDDNGVGNTSYIEQVLRDGPKVSVWLPPF